MWQGFMVNMLYRDSMNGFTTCTSKFAAIPVVRTIMGRMDAIA
jgi:hypothetical protein